VEDASAEHNSRRQDFKWNFNSFRFVGSHGRGSACGEFTGGHRHSL
jgi:hypothetical protein